jgi:signal peptidase I
MYWNGADLAAGGAEDVIAFGRGSRDRAPSGGGRTGRVAMLAVCWTAVVALITSGGALVRSAAIVRETGQGMQTTLRAGQDLVVARGSGIHRGDVVLLNAAGSPVTSRVIALPGDQVACCDAAGRVMVDGRSLDWNYVPVSEQPSGTAYSLTLGSDQIWVLGDNRTTAADSRSWGPVSVSQVKGRAIASVHGGFPALVRTPRAFVREGLAPAGAAIPSAIVKPAAAAVAAAVVLLALAIAHLARRLIRRTGEGAVPGLETQRGHEPPVEVPDG